jgi:hypothetical protein
MNQKPLFTEKKYLVTLVFVTSLFMLWGIAITMADVLNKHFQHVLNLTKSQSAFVQFAVFGAYFVMGVPAGLFMKRFGYKNGVLLGLSLFAGGAFLFVPAAYTSSFGFFGIALFILGCGLSTLETVAHPFVASLGDQRTSDQRINFAQSFNAVGAAFPIRKGKKAPPTTPIEIKEEACCVCGPRFLMPRLKIVGNIMLKKKLIINKARYEVHPKPWATTIHIKILAAA